MKSNNIVTGLQTTECFISVFQLSVTMEGGAKQMEGGRANQKRHQHRHSGPKAEKKKNRKQEAAPDESDARKRNPKAFAVQSAVRIKKAFHR